MNIHSQNSVITLIDSDFQMAILDSYAGQTEAVKIFQQGFKHYSRLTKELEEYRSREAKSKVELDYYRFLLDELLKAGLKAGEQEESEQRLDILSHTEEIKSSLFQAAEKAGRAEMNILSLLNEVINGLVSASKFHPAIEDLAARLKNNQIDIKDILKEIEKLEEEVQYDPEELQRLTQRLDLIYRLEKKHQVQSLEDLFTVIRNIEVRLSEDHNLELKIRSIEEETMLVHKGLMEDAASVSKARKGIKKKFEEEVESKLAQLGMPVARFMVDITHNKDISIGGLDSVKFLFSANKGIPLSEVSKVASGGELSRLMLTIKSMVSRKNLLPTIIFDEIDSGVSGDIAGKVGSILKTMSAEMQVIVITHLPQIAGKGEHHYNVYKSEGRDISMTLIKKLKSNERVEEIARMMSNENISASAMKTARELLAG